MVDTRKGASGDESSHELLPAGAFLIEYPRFQLPHLPQPNSRTRWPVRSAEELES
jgi:hypothetical protein